ncbi:type I-E CRISPR-associated protein Cas6/Cse3/CasE [Streptomyces sp. NPDC056670]|uniref:type I-E CRISPR-associated protein Cas6/Cse3/CasE n=1 Tax=Streptomyces sp. NPDC056670 TaxID=3345904 RepID=UPI0036ABAF88
MTTAATLARVRLNLHSRDVQRDLRDATQMHKTLMRLLPDGLGASPRQAGGLLFRVDQTDHATTVLVQATHTIDPSRLPTDYGYTELKDLTPMFAALRPGLGVRYRITVNPSKTERLPLEQKGRRGKIIALTGAEADQWWHHRATTAGLHLNTLTPTTVQPVRPRGKNASPMRQLLTRYDGIATITDPDTLTHALLTGIGRAKPYGAGLLTLAPASTRG